VHPMRSSSYVVARARNKENEALARGVERFPLQRDSEQKTGLRSGESFHDFKWVTACNSVTFFLVTFLRIHLPAVLFIEVSTNSQLAWNHPTL
jgi:hypothetical protein